MSSTMTTTRRKVVAGAAALALVFAACGDDDDTDEATTDTTEAAEAADGGTDEYCAISTEVNEQEEFPSEEQLEELRAAAPEEIADSVDVVVDAFLAAGDDPFAAFEAPGVDEAFSEVIEPFDAEHCGIDDDDSED